MKRTALKPSRGSLTRDNYVRNSTIPRVSNRKRKLFASYKAFSRHIRETRPECEIRWEGCTGKAQGVHHVIKRSHGGALMPGVKAEAQGQVFVAACNRCNLAIEEQPKRARAEGWSKRNPLRP